MIKIKNITKKYNEQIIFKNLSLNIPKGKMTAIMGKSGIGKTTLLRIIMGFEKIESGEIIGIENKKISVVFQENRLCENLSALKNVSIVCNKNITKDIIKKELYKVGLINVDIPVKDYSGGMKRRVAIVRAILAEYDILILDEPFKGLDIQTKNILLNYIKEKTKNKTIILVTHNINEVKFFESEIINL